MPVHVKKLHIAKSFEELQDHMNVPDVKKFSTAALFKSATNLFREAQNSFLNKDEETSFVQYMRFGAIAVALTRRVDFKKDDVEGKKLLKNSSEALKQADVLKESLLKRYEILQEAHCKAQNTINDLISASHDVQPTQATSPKIIPDDYVPKLPKPEPVEHTISSMKLRDLMSAEPDSFIIMDIRSSTDFEDSHIKHSRCINIPEEMLVPGLTAFKLECQLSPSFLHLWFQRDKADHVIIIDWESEDENSTNPHLKSLIEAMTKWDMNYKLKKPPLLLQGGYKDWMLKYPMFTTQPMSFSLRDRPVTPHFVADLNDIEYPNLDDTPPEQSLMKSKENIEQPGPLFKRTSLANQIKSKVSQTSISDPRNVRSAPAVDRKSKPNSHSILKTSIGDSALSAAAVDSIKDIPAVATKNEEFPKPNNKSNSSSFTQDTVSNQRIFKDLDAKLTEHRPPLRPSQPENNKKIAEGSEENFDFSEMARRKQSLIEKLAQSMTDDPSNTVEHARLVKEINQLEQLLKETRVINVEPKVSIMKEESKPKVVGKENLSEQLEKLRLEKKKKESPKSDFPESTRAPREIVSANSASRKNASHPDKNNPPKGDYTVSLSKQESQDGTSRGGMVRSHSSPNIAQLVLQELTTQVKKPVVDRSLKPNPSQTYQTSDIYRAKKRSMNPVFGYCPVKAATGLKNLGNTCFMNAVIQCLSNTLPVAEYFNTGEYVSDINRENEQGTGGELASEFAAVVKALWMGQYKSFSPKDFKNVVSRCLDVCIGNEQQDSHEFLVVLMDKLHADLSRRASKSDPKLDPNANEEMFWHHHKIYKSSKISDIFEGMLKSTLTCLSCRKTSDSFEVFSCLSLPILNNRCSLKDCLQLFLKPEKISGEAAWDCPRCKQKKEAEKRLRICRLPEILIIQLKRFSYEGLWRRKLQTTVDFDLSFSIPFENNSNSILQKYSLYGIVNHYGTLEGGHYTAYCSNTGSTKWYKYDDHEVSEISSSDIRTSAAYLLFYSATDFQSNL